MDRSKEEYRILANQLLVLVQGDTSALQTRLDLIPAIVSLLQGCPDQIAPARIQQVLSTEWGWANGCFDPGSASPSFLDMPTNIKIINNSYSSKERAAYTPFVRLATATKVEEDPLVSLGKNPDKTAIPDCFHSIEFTQACLALSFSKHTQWARLLHDFSFSVPTWLDPNPLLTYRMLIYRSTVPGISYFIVHEGTNSYRQSAVRDKILLEILRFAVAQFRQAGIESEATCAHTGTGFGGFMAFLVACAFKSHSMLFGPTRVWVTLSDQLREFVKEPNKFVVYYRPDPAQTATFQMTDLVATAEATIPKKLDPLRTEEGVRKHIADSKEATQTLLRLVKALPAGTQSAAIEDLKALVRQTSPWNAEPDTSKYTTFLAGLAAASQLAKPSETPPELAGSAPLAWPADLAFRVLEKPSIAKQTSLFRTLHSIALAVEGQLQDKSPGWFNFAGGELQIFESAHKFTPIFRCFKTDRSIGFTYGGKVENDELIRPLYIHYSERRLWITSELANQAVMRRIAKKFNLVLFEGLSCRDVVLNENKAPAVLQDASPTGTHLLSFSCIMKVALAKTLLEEFVTPGSALPQEFRADVNCFDRETHYYITTTLTTPPFAEMQLQMHIISQHPNNQLTVTTSARLQLTSTTGATATPEQLVGFPGSFFTSLREGSALDLRIYNLTINARSEYYPGQRAPQGVNGKIGFEFLGQERRAEISFSGKSVGFSKTQDISVEVGIIALRSLKFALIRPTIFQGGPETLALLAEASLTLGVPSLTSANPFNAQATINHANQPVINFTASPRSSATTWTPTANRNFSFTALQVSFALTNKHPPLLDGDLEVKGTTRQGQASYGSNLTLRGGSDQLDFDLRLAPGSAPPTLLELISYTNNSPKSWEHLASDLAITCTPIHPQRISSDRLAAAPQFTGSVGLKTTIIPFTLKGDVSVELFRVDSKKVAGHFANGTVACTFTAGSVQLLADLSSHHLGGLDLSVKLLIEGSGSMPTYKTQESSLKLLFGSIEAEHSLNVAETHEWTQDKLGLTLEAVATLVDLLPFTFRLKIKHKFGSYYRNAVPTRIKLTNTKLGEADEPLRRYIAPLTTEIVQCLFDWITPIVGLNSAAFKLDVVHVRAGYRLRSRGLRLDIRLYVNPFGDPPTIRIELPTNDETLFRALLIKRLVEYLGTKLEAYLIANHTTPKALYTCIRICGTAFRTLAKLLPPLISKAEDFTTLFLELMGEGSKVPILVNLALSAREAAAGLTPLKLIPKPEAIRSWAGEPQYTFPPAKANFELRPNLVGLFGRVLTRDLMRDLAVKITETDNILHSLNHSDAVHQARKATVDGLAKSFVALRDAGGEKWRISFKDYKDLALKVEGCFRQLLDMATRKKPPALEIVEEVKGEEQAATASSYQNFDYNRGSRPTDHSNIDLSTADSTDRDYWRTALTDTGRYPPNYYERKWPPREYHSALISKLVEMELPKFCKGNPKLADRLLGSISYHVYQKVNPFALAAALEAEFDSEMRGQQLAESLATALGLKENAPLLAKKMTAVWEDQETYERFMQAANDTMEKVEPLMDRLSHLVVSNVANDEVLLDFTTFIAKLRKGPDEEKLVATARGADKLNGTYNGNDLSRMLPTQAALLAFRRDNVQLVKNDDGTPEDKVAEAMETLWYLRFMEHSLVCFNYIGVQSQSTSESATEELEILDDARKQQRRRGPLVVVVDTSGSMDNDNVDTLSKAITIAAMKIVDAEHRPLFAILAGVCPHADQHGDSPCPYFKGKSVMKEGKFPCGFNSPTQLSRKADGIDDLVQFLAFKPHGDESFEAAFNELEKLLNDKSRVPAENWTFGDILFITDGDWTNDNVGKAATILRKAKAEKGVSITGISTSNVPNDVFIGLTEEKVEYWQDFWEVQNQ